MTKTPNKMRRESDGEVQALIAALRQHDGDKDYNNERKREELSRVRDRLVAAGKAAVPHLIEVMADHDTWSIYYAVEALGEIGDERAIRPLVDLLEDPGLGLDASEALVGIGQTSVPHAIEKVEYRVAHPLKERDRIRQVTNHALSTIGAIRCEKSVTFLTDLLDGYLSELPKETFNVEQHEWRYQNVDFFHLLDCMVQQQDGRAVPYIERARDAFPEEYVDHQICDLAIQRIEEGKVEGYLPLDALELTLPTEVIMEAMSEALFGEEGALDRKIGEDFWDDGDLERLEARWRMTDGVCRLCGGRYRKGGMTRHLKSCLSKETSLRSSGGRRSDKKSFFHIVVEGKYCPEYWMHLEVPVDSKLRILDNFLRRTWLECCGHMSMFWIGETFYSSHPLREYGDRGLDTRLGNVLHVGRGFRYEYDAGSTTELAVRVISEREVEAGWKGIRILARNDPPEIGCESCGKTATRVCCECVYDNEGWLCDECVPRHGCGDEMLLPVVNSPRVGTCGYVGGGADI